MSIGLRPGYFGGNYLGNRAQPVRDRRRPERAGLSKCRICNCAGDLTLDRLEDRRGLLEHFDRLRRDVDTRRRVRLAGPLPSRGLRTGRRRNAAAGVRPDARRSAAPRPLRPQPWGQSTLLARRLVEAGCTFVTVHCGGWDHHWDLKVGYGPLSAAWSTRWSSALFEDLHDRGLARKGAGDDVRRVQPHAEDEQRRQRRPAGSKGTPGRDHWGNAMCCLIGGGGVQGRPDRRLDRRQRRSAQGPPADAGRLARDDVSRAGRRPADRDHRPLAAAPFRPCRKAK